MIMPMVAQRAPYTLIILDDNEPLNPREDCDNFSKMVCWHGRYNLGDEHNYENPSDFLIALMEQKLGDADKADKKYSELCSRIVERDYKGYGSYRKEVDDCVLEYLSDSFIILPLYLYDHSGITMNTRGFTCQWDSGQVGLIYASYEDVKKEYGSVTPQTLMLAEDLLRFEVKNYDYYISGQCYGFKLFEEQQEIDSCWGFLGDLSEVQACVKDHLPKNCEALADSLEYQMSVDEEELINQLYRVDYEQPMLEM